MNTTCSPSPSHGRSSLKLARRRGRLPRLTAGAIAILAVLGAAYVLVPTPSAASAPVHAPVTAVPVTNGFADLIEAVQPAVVNVSVAGTVEQARLGGTPFPPGSPFEEFFRRHFDLPPGYEMPENRAQRYEGAGSGFIIDADGYVVTNNHVVENADEIRVTLNDGTTLDATLVGTDPKTDLALLKVDTDEPLPYTEFGDSDRTRVGDWVVAIGNPFGLGGTATTGIVSARGRDIQSGPFDDFLQVDAPINRGNSGGPLFDTTGRVIGINTAIYSPNGGNVGIAFAIPASQARPILDQLRTSGRVERGWLGVQIQTVDEELASSLGLDEARGALVASVVPGSPADEAGLEPGDVILSYDSKPVEQLKDLPRLVAESRNGERVDVRFWRNGKQHDLDVRIAMQPRETDVDTAIADAGDHDRPRLGLTLSELTEEARSRFRTGDDVEGALIVDVARDSDAAAKGLRPGDVIVGVGTEDVHSVEDAIGAVRLAADEGKPSVALRVARGEDTRYVAVRFA